MSAEGLVQVRRRPAGRRLTGAVLLAAVGAAQTPAAAECFSAASLEVQLLNKRYANAALLIEVMGPEPELCKDFGTGVLVSSSGHVLTARHVVDKPGCSDLGIYARFPWDSGNVVEMDIVQLDARDAAFLRPAGGAEWPAPRSKYCTAPITTDEGQSNEAFLRFGHIDTGSKPYGYGGNVILPSAETGQPPLQLVCTVMRHGDSGGPLFSIPGGDLIGITLKKRDKDKYGYEVGNQGYILPLNVLSQTYPALFDSAAQCETEAVVNVAMEDLEIDVPYEVGVGAPVADGSAARIQNARFQPVFGYSFAEITGVAAHDANGRPLSAPNCADAATGSCVDAEIKDGSLSVTVRAVPSPQAAGEPIASVVVYTTQEIGNLGAEWLEASKPDLSAKYASGDVTADEATAILEALADAPGAQLDLQAPLQTIVTIPVRPATEAAGAEEIMQAPSGLDVLKSVEGSFDSIQDAIGDTGMGSGG